MYAKIRQFLTRSAVGRALTFGLVLMLVAYGVKLFYLDNKEAEQQRDQREAAGALEAMAATLTERLQSADDLKAAFDELPEATGWYPERIACGRTATLEAPDAFWQGLGLEAGQSVGLQYRFERTEDAFVILARRDDDCDGIFFVARLDGLANWTGGVETGITYDHPQE